MVNATTEIAENSQVGQSNSMGEGQIKDTQHSAGGCSLVPEAKTLNVGGGNLVNFVEQTYNLPPHAANVTKNLMNLAAEPQILAADLVEEPSEATEHYFIAADPVYNIVVDETASIDPNVKNPELITAILMLHTAAPRATSRRRNPIMDFTKSVMLTLEEYVNAALEVKRARLAMAAE